MAPLDPHAVEGSLLFTALRDQFLPDLPIGLACLELEPAFAFALVIALLERVRGSALPLVERDLDEAPVELAGESLLLLGVLVPEGGSTPRA